MKKLLFFVFISLLLHSLLLLIEATPPSGAADPIKIDIIPKEKPTEPTPPAPEPTPTPPHPDEVLLPTPDPERPVEMAPEKPLPEPMPEPLQPEGQQPPLPVPDTPRESLPAITPERYNPEAPPAPFTYSDFLKEQLNATETFGPDRSIDDIIRRELAQKGNSDDSVSFHDLPSKLDSYFYKFARSLYGVWKYPPAAAKRGEQGIVRVTFAITREGKIIDINLLESSGYSELDREALRTLKTMAPVPLPESYEHELLHINGYFIYTQNGQYRLY